MIWSWWIWLAGAVGLAILEMLVPGYLFLGFAIGAAATGLVLLAGGLFGGLIAGTLTGTLLFFAGASLVAWVVLRRVFAPTGGGSVQTFDRDINDD
ncbi:MAG: hypothetical protein ABNH26_02505 [Celeribacter sp.]|jgi:membrane protein implicated in regulation of membrane protease activity